MSCWTEHPASVGETYSEHMRTALWFSGKLALAAMCCTLHAVFPFAFKKTGSEIITQLHDRMVAHRSKL